MCDKGIIAGLMFGGKSAKQAMTPAANGRIHIDRELCKALGRTSDEKLGQTNLQTIRERRVGDGGKSDIHDPVDGVEVDRDGDEHSGDGHPQG